MGRERRKRDAKINERRREGREKHVVLDDDRGDVCVYMKGS